MAEEKSDTAGKMIGWSIGNGMQKKPLDELLEFPCDFTFKIIGAIDGDFEASVIQGINAFVQKPVTVVRSQIKKSSQKKYTSLTLVLHVEQSQDIYDVYEACRGMPHIKFVL